MSSAAVIWTCGCSSVPQRLEHAVGEAERQHVLDGLLAQVVVDAEDLRLVEHREHRLVELAASASVVPNGFSMITRTSAPSRSVSSWRPSASTMTGKNSGAVDR
jgi:hypothetical protein